MGWTLELDECVVLVRASQASNPFILIRGGIAHAIPKTEALALHVATGNKEYTSQWAKATLEKFGGQPFTADDWHLMSF